MMDAAPVALGRPRWPVTLLTGMLGSGKTTLLRHALSEANMAGTVVLINEIGEIGIDHHLVEQYRRRNHPVARRLPVLRLPSRSSANLERATHPVATRGRL